MLPQYRSGEAKLILNCSAGGQHACAIAAGLGIETVVVPRFSSILSAYGIACADLTAESTSPYAVSIPDEFASSPVYHELEKRVEGLRMDAERQLVEQGVSKGDIEYSTYVSTHYEGSDTVLQVAFTPNLKVDFITAHLRETSFSMGRAVHISNVRVFAVGKSVSTNSADFAPALQQADCGTLPTPLPQSTSSAYFEVGGHIQQIDAPVYTLSQIPIGSTICGPAIIVDSTQTIVVEPSTRATCLPEHVILRLDSTATVRHVSDDKNLNVDPIELAVFANRFMSIAEQMGHTLQRTSVSVSIKERLDFSCSIHGTDGALVANAPHIPVHLGSMQYAVQAQHQHWLGQLKPGDVLLTNHPQWGGKSCLFPGTVGCRRVTDEGRYPSARPDRHHTGLPA